MSNNSEKNFIFHVQNFGSRNDTVFCGVFDGHGPLGHMVAKRVRDVLPLKLTDDWKCGESREFSASSPGNFASEHSTASPKEEIRDSTKFEEKDEHSQNLKMLKDSLLKAFRNMDKELKQQPGIDCFSSGSTAVTLIKQVKHYSLTSYSVYIFFEANT